MRPRRKVHSRSRESQNLISCQALKNARVNRMALTGEVKGSLVEDLDRQRAIICEQVVSAIARFACTFPTATPFSWSLRA